MAHDTFLDGRVQLCCGDSIHFLRDQPDNRYDSIVTDPPYGLAFMGKWWDSGDAAFSVEFWRECLRVLKPGGHVLAFGGTRTYHRLACAIEDAGFEIRDMVQWLYGSGFPKSHNVSKAIDEEAGAVREVVERGAAVKRMIPGADQHKAGWEKTNGREYVPEVTAAATPEAAEWEGWGTAIKPAVEPICMARKPLSEPTVAANVLRWRTGALNIGATRVGTEVVEQGRAGRSVEKSGSISLEGGSLKATELISGVGRWPANVVHDDSDEVVGEFPAEAGAFAPVRGTEPSNAVTNVYGARERPATVHHGDSGSAARFFYSAKADADDRLGSKHPTVKPVELMQWLVRMVTPPNGLVLDPFAGTGTTAEACFREGARCMVVERESEYQADIRRRMALILSGPAERKRESIKAKKLPVDHGPLFGELG